MLTQIADELHRQTDVCRNALLRSNHIICIWFYGTGNFQRSRKTRVKSQKIKVALSCLKSGTDLVAVIGADVGGCRLERVAQLRIQTLVGRVDLRARHFKIGVAQFVQALAVFAQRDVAALADVTDDIGYDIRDAGGHLCAQEQAVAADFFVSELAYHIKYPFSVLR